MCFFKFILIAFLISLSVKYIESVKYEHKDLNFYKSSSFDNNDELLKRYLDIYQNYTVKVYYFNITNKDEYLTAKEEPPFKVQELDPMLVKSKSEVKIENQNDNLISIKKNTTYYMYEELNDKIKDYEFYLIRDLYADVLNEPDFVEANIRTNHEFQIPFMRKEFRKMIGFSFTNVDEPLIYNGKDNLNKFGVIKCLDEKFIRQCWNNSACDLVEGSRDLNLPNYELEFGPKTSFYSLIFKRKFNIRYKEDLEFKGIKVKRYELDESIFDMTLEENKFYCWDKSKKISETSICNLKGILDTSRCDMNLVTTLPHFLNASPEILNQVGVKGLNPNPSQHTSYFDIDPITGILLRSKIAIQKNNYLKISRLKNNKNGDVLIPRFWVLEEFEIDDEKASHFYKIVN